MIALSVEAQQSKFLVSQGLRDDRDFVAKVHCEDSVNIALQRLGESPVGYGCCLLSVFMLPKASAWCLESGAVIAVVSVVLNAGNVYGQILPGQASPPSQRLLPLNAASLTVEKAAMPLDQVANTINLQMESDRAQPQPVEGISFEEIPIIGALVDEQGNFDWGVDLPVSVNVADVMGAYGVVVSANFNMPHTDNTARSAVAPLDR